MTSVLRWGWSVVAGTLTGIARFAFLLVLLVIGLLVVGLVEGDGLPGKMVLSLDMRDPISDSAVETPFAIGPQPLTVMDTILALDAASRDPRVKGVWMRVGTGGLSVAQAEELGTALARFKKSGKFVIAHSQGFLSPGLGDYLTAASADEIWMQPKSPFGAAGEGGSELFLRGLFDKIGAVPQIAKRAEFKSAADMYMERAMTPQDREQLTVLLGSWYQWATEGVAAARKLDRATVASDFDQSPQFTDDAKKHGLVDRVGYDDDSYDAAITRAGDGAKAVHMQDYIRARSNFAGLGSGPHVALIEGAGEIVDGASGSSMFGGEAMGGDDLARAIREATYDNDVKAIILRVDSPGGSVSASDQILDAVKKAQAKGKPVVVSMGSVAASGGYYISCAANEIIAEPGTLTGSIGVLTGKVSFAGTLEKVGVGADQVSVGKNTLMDSAVTPFTPDQWAALNHQADEIYADFTGKVAAGRKLPLAKVQEIARGRVWTGADANARGLVDKLGGFWTAVDAVKHIAGIAPDEEVVFKRYPKQKTFFEALNELFGGTEATARALVGLNALLNAPPVHAMIEAQDALPRHGIELRATNLPH